MLNRKSSSSALCCQSTCMQGTQWEQTFSNCYHHLYSKLHCDFPNHHPLVHFNEHVNFLLIAFCCGTFQMTSVWLICDINVSVFKVFHPPSYTNGAHAGISVHITKLPTDVCSWVVLYKELNHCLLVKQYVSDICFVTVRCGNSSGGHVPGMYSCWSAWMLLMILHSVFYYIWSRCM